MKIGSLIYATDQGLGVLAKSFFDAGIITDVRVVRHGRRPEHDEWYPGSVRITNLNDERQIKETMEWCQGMDAMLFLETPFIWNLLPYCRAHGVKTFLEVMYECMPVELPYQPDHFICPSLLDLQYYPDRSTFIPVPVQVRGRLRTRVKVFVHNAGHGGLKGRNGTRELLEAIPLLKSDARFIIRSQDPLEAKWSQYPWSKIDVRFGTSSYDTLYDEGDAFVFPEKFNGLSLVLQEAHAAGMLVMAGNRFPMNTWLPKEPLIPIRHTKRQRVSPRCNEFDEAHYNPRDIAATIDAWYGKDITEFSLLGKRYAEDNSWENLKPQYMELLYGLVNRR